MVVKHKLVPKWGLGEIVAVNGTTIAVNFQNVGTKDLDSTVAPLELVRDRKVTIYNSRPDSDKAKIEADVNYFAKPDKIFSLKDLRKKGLPPSESGVYGWYFDEPPDYVPTTNCERKWVWFKRWWLLYIGQAKDLEDRILDYHIKGKHYAEGTMSSFRLSLGCLLSDKYGLNLYYPPESFAKKDKKLNNWLKKHARVTWIETENIDAIEKKAIDRYTLPLNHKYNEHPLKSPLSNLRAEFKNIARNSVRRPKKKHFRKAYKRFVRQCKALGIKK